MASIIASIIEPPIDNPIKSITAATVAANEHYLKIDGAGNYLIIDGAGHKLRIDGAT